MTVVLEYIWIENFKNIKSEGFNFSTTHSYHYNKIGSTLTFTERDTPQIDHFFGRTIANLTAVIGQNGSGKSNLLEFISILYSQAEGFESQPFLAIFFNGTEREVYSHSSLKVNFENDNLFEVYFFDSELIKNLRFPFSARDGLVYYSNVYSGQLKPFQIKGQDKYIDISKDWQVNYHDETIHSNTSQNNGAKYGYTTFEVNTQIQFLNNPIANTLGLKLPDFLTVSLTHLYSTEHILNSFEKNLPNSFIEQINDIHNKLNGDSFLDLLVQKLIFVKFYETAKLFVFNQIEIMVNNAFTILNSDEDDLKVHLLNSIFESPNDSDFVKPIDLLELDLQAFDKESQLIIPTNKLSIFNTLLKIIRICNLQFASIFEYNWLFGKEQNLGRLSTGEEALLSFYARFYAYIQEIRNRANLLLIDEAELGYHPEWQRNYVSNLVSFINNIFQSCYPLKRLQIIVTSHSPFLLSDLPKENVIFLKKGGDGNCEVVADAVKQPTFAANIHTIFSDSFFMEGGLMGQFSKNAINAIVRAMNRQEEDSHTWHNEWARNSKNWLPFIKNIGEPILRTKLLELYHSSTQTNIDEQIRFHESEVKRLKNKRDEKQ